MITLKRRHRQTKIETLFLLLLILTITGFLIFSNWRIFQKRMQLLGTIEVLESKIQLLKQKNQKLKQQISQSSDETYLEKEAIERFNLKPPGTQVVVVKEEKSEEQKPQPQKSFWQIILEKLGIKQEQD